MTAIRSNQTENAANALPSRPKALVYWPALLLWSGFLLLTAYGGALSLPFMADDFFQFPFVDRHTFSEIWQTAEGLYYFRPVAFAYWKVAASLFDGHNPLFLHAGNLAVHWINALLVGWLADRLWAAVPPGLPWPSGWLRRFLAASLYILFPLGYEAVPWVAAFMHPAATMLVLLSVTGYLQLRDKGSIFWGVAGLVCAFLAPFAHENGAVTLPLLAAVEATRPPDGRKSSRQRLGLLALWAIPLLLWYLIWRQEPVAVGTGGLGVNNLPAMLRNTTYTLQAMAYPVTWFGVSILRRLPVAELPATAVLSLLTLAGAAWVQWRGGGDRRSLLPWLWTLIASLPAIAFLSYAYLQAAPRVLTLAGVGIVWLWVDVFCFLAGIIRRYTKSWALPALFTGALVALVLLQSLTYIREQMRTYEAGGALIWDIIAKTVAANEAQQTAVFANLPTWLALPRSHFALGEEGAMLMPTADNIATLVSVHTGRPAQILAIEHAATRQEMPYYHGVIAGTPDWPQLAESGAQLFTTRYRPDMLFAQPVGVLEMTAEHLADQPPALFAGCLVLQAVDTSVDEQQLAVDLTWQQECAVPPELTVFVHILDENGRLLAQADGDPLLGIVPFASWPEGVIARDQRLAEVEETAAQLLIGLYDRFSGERAPAQSAAGEALEDNALQIPLHERP